MQPLRRTPTIIRRSRRLKGDEPEQTTIFSPALGLGWDKRGPTIQSLLAGSGSFEDIVYEDDDDENEDRDTIEEVGAKKKVKISRADRLKRRKLYRRNKAKIKKNAKRYRKTGAFKRYKKKDFMGSNH